MDVASHKKLSVCFGMEVDQYFW